MFKIDIYGVPPSQPSDYQLAEAAIDRAKRELKGKQHPAYATVTDTTTKTIIWRGNLSESGEIVESLKNAT